MKLVDIAVRRPVTIWMFTFAVLLFGMVSLSRLSLNLLPELSYPTLTIRTDYQGAAPGEVEQLISKPIEEAIGVVKGVHKVQSVSKAGQSDVVLEFDWGTKMDLASLEVREKLDILPLPLDVKKPLLLKFNPSLDPIQRLGLKFKAQDTQFNENSLKGLRTFAEEEIKRKLESVSGVASVKVGGGLENEIQVLVDPKKTSQLNITIEQIVNRLTQENVNVSGGRVSDNTQEFLVRTLNQFKNLDQMRDMFVANVEGKKIRLGDIAEVLDTHKERSSVNRINGVEAVEIAIYKEGDANTVTVADNIAKRLKTLRKELPEKYELAQVYDQSSFIRNAISEVKNAAIIGGILAMFILYLFLKNIWPTLIISISIPVSIIATFNLMYGNDISLNIMSLGGIALAIGLLVDNSIVVLENIDRRKSMKDPIRQAAAEGTKEVSTAITASTLTTMAVFFPLVFVEGVAGQLFSDQALTVTFALMASLVVALTLIPMIAAREKDPANAPTYVPDNTPAKKPTTQFGKIMHTIGTPFRLLFKGLYFLVLGLVTVVMTLVKAVSWVLKQVFRPLLWGFEKFYDGASKVYSGLLNFSLQQRALMVAVIGGVSVYAITLLPKLGVELIPPMSQGEFFVEVTLPTGTHLDKTDGRLQSLAQYTEALPLVEKTYSLAGTGSLMNASPSQGGDHWGRLNVVLKSGATQADEDAVKSEMRKYLTNLPGVQSKFGKPELFSFKTPLEIELSGYDLSMLKRYSDQVAEKLGQRERFVDVKTTLEDGNPELKIRFDHAKLAQLGLTAPSVSKLIASKVGGDLAGKYSINDRKVDILVRTAEQDRNSVEDIRNIIVNPNSANPLPLDAVADVELSIGPSEITRIGQQRVALVSANLAFGDLGDAIVEAKEVIKSITAPYSVQMKITGQNEEMDVSFNSLKFALALAIFLVYLVMASQFESLLHPLLILFTVPLAGAGSIYGLYFTGTHISVVVFIGLIMLAGIVVNNAIVLIDRINQLREQGKERYDAIVEASMTRFRPILMTTLTTALGLLPLAVGVGEGSELRKPMAITVIYGLLFASTLTLIFIPVLYSIFDRKRFEAPSHG